MMAMRDLDVNKLELIQIGEWVVLRGGEYMRHIAVVVRYIRWRGGVIDEAVGPRSRQCKSEIVGEGGRGRVP